MNSRHGNLSIGVALTMASILACSVRIGTGAAAHAGLLSNELTLQRSEQIYRLITQSQRPMRISVSGTSVQSLTSVSASGRVIVIMVDDMGGPSVTVTWEPGGAELISISNNSTSNSSITNRSHDPSARRPEALGKLEAAHLSWRWLKRLGIAAEAPKWKLEADPRAQSEQFYTACWIAPGRNVRVAIRYETGELKTIVVQRSGKQIRSPVSAMVGQVRPGRLTSIAFSPPAR